MKQLLIVLASVMCICYTTNSFAQSVNENSIILDNKDNEGQTTVEVKNGKLYIDGKKISDLKKDTRIKIVKKNTTSENHDFKFDFDNMDMPFQQERKPFGFINNKAMLGIRTQDTKLGPEVKEVLEGSAAEKAGLQ